MKSPPASSAFLVLLLLVSSAQLLVFDNANHDGFSKVIDPFLSINRHSSSGERSRTATMILTSPSPPTPSQRLKLGSLSMIMSSMAGVTTVRAPEDNFKQIIALDFVSGAYSPRSFRPTLDVSVSEIGAPYVWQTVKDAHGDPVDGSGVIIGVIDTGVDLSHPDLRFPNGTSKVLYVWDQTESGKPPHGFTYGVECSWDQINRGECREKDTFGHGTHVASIAASSGLASDIYRGIAPGAALFVVKSGGATCNGESWTFDEGAIIDGLHYLVGKARALGMRLVINLSLGGNVGGHDGTSPLELAIDDLKGQGVTVIVSAGNEADNQGHVTGSLNPANPTRVNWAPVGEGSNAFVDIWYPNDRAISATLVTPSGEAVSGPTPDNGTRASDGLVKIVPATTAKGTELAISIETKGVLPTTGWSIILKIADNGPSLSWNAWVDGDSCSYPPAVFSSGEGYTIDEKGTISVPATSNSAIAVGAYVTKNSWVNKAGKDILVKDYRVGEIAEFSSRGPTRDGRTKPDVAAPGLFIAAARSMDVPSSDSDPDQYHRILAGTSMAAPHVGGVIALMLQYNPQLTPGEIRSILVEGAYLDEFTGLIETSEGSDNWGWGKADARTAISLFRVSSILEPVPSVFGVNLTVDGEHQGLLYGGKVFTLRFLAGTVHTLQVVGQTFTENDTRYVIKENSAVFSANGVFAPYACVQYLLSLESPLGQAEGEGWYDAGSYPNFRVNPLVASKGLEQLIGVAFFFDHWVDEHGNKTSSGTLRMDSPHALTAVWRARLADWRPALLLIAAVVALMLILRHWRGRLRRRLSISESIDTRWKSCVHAATRHLSQL